MSNAVIVVSSGIREKELRQRTLQCICSCLRENDVSCHVVFYPTEMENIIQDKKANGGGEIATVFLSDGFMPAKDAARSVADANTDVLGVAYVRDPEWLKHREFFFTRNERDTTFFRTVASLLRQT